MQVDASMLVTAGFLTTLVLSMKWARKEQHDKVTMFWFGAWGVVGALAGGHLLYALSQPEELAANPLLLLDVLEGGKAIFGAMLGAGLLGWLYLYREKEHPLPYADAAAPAIALGYVIVRVGCFLNGDDFGTLTTVPWAVTFGPGTEAFADHVARGWISRTAASTLPVHPTQLYHAAAGIFLFVLLSRWRGTWQGSRFALALAGYGVIRFFLQFFRGDSVPVIAGLDDSQLFSILFIGAAALLWFIRGRKQCAASLASEAPASRDISVENAQ